MKIELTDEISETYFFPRKLNLLKRFLNYDTYVKNELMAYHPGFSTESVWDYKKANDGFLVCVLDRELYEEKRLLNPFCMFVKTENGKEQKLFSSLKFMRNGKKRKLKSMVTGFVLSLAITVILVPLVLSGCGFLADESYVNEPAVIPDLTETDTEKTKEYDPMLSEASRVLESLSEIECSISRISCIGNRESTEEKLLVWVTGTNVKDAISKVSLCKNVETVFVEEISYNGDECDFCLEIKFNSKSLFIPASDKILLNSAEIHNFFSLAVTDQVSVGDVKLKNAHLDDINGEVIFECEVSERGLEFIFENLSRSLWESHFQTQKEKLVITSFLMNEESQINGKSSFFVELTVSYLELIEEIPSLFISNFKKINWKWKNPIKDKTDHLNIADSKPESLEIGRIQKGENYIIYYRTPEGKIIQKRG